MPTTMPIEESLPGETLSVLIGRQLIRALGKPRKLLKVKVFPVGDSNYRVNVLVGSDANSARITDSFFLTADAKGNITARRRRSSGDTEHPLEPPIAQNNERATRP